MSGALDKGQLTLDTLTLNKVLKKQRDFIVEKPTLMTEFEPKKKPSNHATKTKLITERRKAVNVLNNRWERLEDLRIRILIEMKSLKGFHDFLNVLKKENARLLGIHGKKIEDKVNSNTFYFKIQVNEIIDSFYEYNFVEWRKSNHFNCN